MHDDTDPLRRKIWIFAAVLALGAHLAFAAFAIARMSEPDDDDLGAPGIEIAYELASTQNAMSELPPGPESEASAASPPVVEQKTAEKQTDLPKETPVESENPDRLVTIEKTDKPKEEEPEPKAKMMAERAELDKKLAEEKAKVEAAKAAAAAAARGRRGG